MHLRDLNPLENFLRAIDVKLEAFAVCEIGSGWRLKVAPTDKILCHFVLRGHGSLEASGDQTAIGPCAVIVVPPGTTKCIVGPGETTKEARAVEVCGLHGHKLLSFKARDEATDLLVGCATISVGSGTEAAIFSELTAPLVAHLDADQVAIYFDALLRELSEVRIGTAVMAECLMKQILLSMLREQIGTFASKALMGSPRSNPRLLAAITRVMEHPDERHSVSSLASLVGMSRSSFAGAFTAEYELPPMEFVQKVRMQSARRLLKTSDLPIKSLAAAVGYSSRSQFSHAFKAEFGIDPSAFRARAHLEIA